MKDDYSDFLKTKHTRIEQSGIDVSESEMNPMLFDFQKFIVKKALKAGKYAFIENKNQLSLFNDEVKDE